jgi:RNA polymerase sigma-70 factor, ECF subfamily
VSTDDRQLIERLAQNDSAAAEEIVRTYGDRLLRSAYLLCGHRTDAHDLVQEVFVQAVRAAPRYQGKSSAFTWLYGILLNISRHYLRKRSAQKKIFTQRMLKEEIPQEPDGRGGDSKWASAVFTWALHQLSDEHREVIVLRFFDGLKIEQIVDYLGLAEGTIKSRLHYALKELKKILPPDLNLFEL